MEKKWIGSLEVPVVGIGCNKFGWRIDANGAAAVVDAALDADVNFFDTADIYGEGRSEEFLGHALAERRNQAIIATKFGMKMDEQSVGACPEYVMRAVENSLRRLATDRIDLYQLHRPDPTVPIADTLGALDRLVRAGKVREIGCSNFSAGQIREAEEAARGGARFVSVQNEYNLINREPEAHVLPACTRLGLAFLPYFPLANGLLTGKYRLGKPLPAGTRGGDAWGPKVFTERNLQVVESLIQFAESRGHTLLELAISWLGQRPAVASVIAGAKSPEQVRANAAAAGWKMSDAEFEEIDRIAPPPA
jgi:aryl-alcohol dehydrogenase-like predicted oxidoreductase